MVAIRRHGGSLSHTCTLLLPHSIARFIQHQPQHFAKAKEWKRSGHIPAFGNWDLANELPITRYFECATTTQPRLARYTSSSAQTRHHNKPRPLRNHNKQKQEARCRHGNKGKLYDVREQPRKAIRISKQLQKDDTVPRTPKPVDEDLYKIPPELLHTTKRKKMLGFISRCLVLLVCHEKC